MCLSNSDRNFVGYSLVPRHHPARVSLEYKQQSALGLVLGLGPRLCGLLLAISLHTRTSLLNRQDTVVAMMAAEKLTHMTVRFRCLVVGHVYV